jgi:hypothetical protein
VPWQLLLPHARKRADRTLSVLCAARDLLVILYGGPVPYVLREQQFSTNSGGQDLSSRYEFVGECYLEGYMYGLGIEEQEKKGLPRETFVLV